MWQDSTHLSSLTSHMQGFSTARLMPVNPLHLPVNESNANVANAAVPWPEQRSGSRRARRASLQKQNVTDEYLRCCSSSSGVGPLDTGRGRVA